MPLFISQPWSGRRNRTRGLYFKGSAYALPSRSVRAFPALTSRSPSTPKLSKRFKPWSGRRESKPAGFTSRAPLTLRPHAPFALFLRSLRVHPLLPNFLNASNPGAGDGNRTRGLYFEGSAYAAPSRSVRAFPALTSRSPSTPKLSKRFKPWSGRRESNPRALLRGLRLRCALTLRSRFSGAHFAFTLYSQTF